MSGRWGATGSLCLVLLLAIGSPVGAQQGGASWDDVPDPGQRRVLPVVGSAPSIEFVGNFSIPGIGGDAIVVLDMNNDGDNDLVVAADVPTGIEVSVYTGDNDGNYTFSDSKIITDGTSAGLMLVDELSGNAYPDVVVPTASGFVVMKRNAASFANPVTYGGSRPTQLHDMDGDGHVDVVGSGEYFANNGTGVFGAGQNVIGAVLHTDIDGDGLSDAVDLDPDGYPGLEVASVAYGTGGGNHGAKVEAWVSLEAEHSTGLFVGDQDQDGTQELYIPTDREWRAGEHLYTLATVEDDGGGFSEFEIELAEIGVEGWVRDLDGDGDQDIVILTPSLIYVNEAVSGGFSLSAFAAPFATFRTPTMADIDGDGIADVVDIRDDEVVYALGVGPGSTPGTLTVATGQPDMCVDVFRSGVGAYTGSSGTTGLGGNVTFSLSSGNYDLFVWDCHYESTGVMTRHPYAWQTVRSASGDSVGPGVLVNPGALTVASVQLDLGAIYSGTVTDIRSGDPIARITVDGGSPDFTGTLTDTAGQWSWVGVPEKDLPELGFQDLEGFYFMDSQTGATAEIGDVNVGVDQALDGRLVDARDNIFAKDVIWIADQGITAGCESTGYLYCPGDSISRGQMAAFLVRALGLTDVDPSISFDDTSNSIFQQDILKLATAGITAGCNADGSSYCPGDSVKRGQMAAFLVRAFDLTDIDPSIAFNDTGNSIFQQDILRLATAGVTFGCNSGGTEFCPGKEVTRGQMAAFLRRALEDT